MKYRIIRILDIIAFLFCVGLIIYEYTFSEVKDMKIILKASKILVALLLGFFGIKHKKSIFDNSLYKDRYKEVIGDAFSNDKRSFNKLIKVCINFSYGKYKKAIKILDDLYEHSCLNSQDYGTVMGFKALCYENMSKPESAIECYKEALIYDNTNSYFWNNLGLLYSRNNDRELAKEAFFRSINGNRVLDAAYNNLGLVYLREDDYYKALENFLHALEINSNFLSAISGIALCYHVIEDTCNQEKYTKLYIEKGGNAAKLQAAIDSLDKNKLKKVI